MSETGPELSTKEMDLIFLVGYYTLMLGNIKLSPDWRVAYEERLLELKERLNDFRI